MTHKEIFQEIYDALETVGVEIGIIAWGRNHNIRARGDHYICFTDDFQNVVSETILLTDCDIIRKIVLLLHEKGHSTAWHNMNPQERKHTCYERARNYNSFDVFGWEKKAWDLCWGEATLFGLHEDEDFAKIYFEERELGLESYKVERIIISQSI